MSEGPLVSVIIPTYKRNSYLQKCLEAAVAQTYAPIEIIVVDDSGTEHAKSVVSRFQDITYLPLEENKGPTAARNLGLDTASGDYIQLLDDDDVLEPRKIESQVERLEENDDAGVAYCGFSEGAATYRPRPDGEGDVLELVLQFELSGCVTSTMLIGAEHMSEIHPLPDTDGSDDTYWKFKLARRTHFVYVDEILVRREAPEDRRSQSWPAIQAQYALLEEYADLYDQYDDAVRNRAKAGILQRVALHQATNKFWSGEAILNAIRSLRTDPNPSMIHYALPLAVLFGKLSLIPAQFVFRRVSN